MKLDPRIRGYLDHTWGPIVGVVLNILVVFILIKYVVFEAKEGTSEIEVTITDPIETTLDELEQELEMLEEFEPVDMVDIPNDMSMDIDAPPEIDASPSPTMDTAMDFAALDIQTASSPLVMRGLYESRSAGGRQAALGRHGGRHGASTEAAVIRALRWLKAQQRSDGSWSRNPEGMTGLALLAFLAHGETTSSAEFGETVMKAIQYLIRRQADDGMIGSGRSDGGRPVYGHGFATYALAEAFSLTKIPMIRQPLEKAVDVIIRGQQKDIGFWDYNWKKDGRLDTSLTALMVQALKAAHIAGIRRPGMDETIQQTIAGLKTRVFDAETGGFGYSRVERNNANMTGAAALALHLLGEGGSREARAGVNALNTVNCDFGNPIHNPMYGWFYITQAKFQAGGPTWRTWNDRFAPQFVKAQHQEGFWSNIDSTGSGEGDVYSTTLAALTLMVYYRHLPSYQIVQETTPAEPEKKSDEVVIRIL